MNLIRHYLVLVPLRRVQNQSNRILQDLDSKYKKITGQNKFKEGEKYEIPTINPIKMKLRKQINEQKKKYDSSTRKKNYFKENPQIYLSEKDIQIKIFNCKSIEKILNLYNGHKFIFSIKNIITTFTCLANLTIKEKEKLPFKDKRTQSLIFNAEQNIEKMNNREKTLLLWSLSKCKINESIVENLIKNIIKNIKNLDFKDISLLGWCLSKYKIRNSMYFGTISLRLCEILQNKNFLIQKNKNENEEMIEKKTKESSDSEDEDYFQYNEDEKINNQEIIELKSLSIILWSFGKVKMQDKELFSLIDDLILNNFENFTLKMMNLIIHSYISLNYIENCIWKEKLLNKFEKNEYNLEEESVLTLKTLLNSFSNLKFINKNEIIIKILNVLMKKQNSKKFSGKFLSEIIWALAKNNIFQKELTQKLKENTIENITKLNSIDCCQCFYGFCVFRNLSNFKSFYDVLELLSERLYYLKPKMNKKGISIILKGQEIAKYQNRNLDF